ncbi:MAG TPA: hypothetical protein VMT85_21235, partial [Thermoanaerobaculia bacterium]|nr:hypothetical protein [Thermoanaerobaculia bacterium]
MKIAASPPTPETSGRSDVRARARPGESIARAESVEPARLPEPGKVASLPGTDTPARDRYLPRGVWWRNAFLIGFLLLQLTLPLRGLVREKLETRGNFSWNMYSQVYSCETRYVLLTPTGRGEWIDPREYSRDPGRIATVFRNDWLPVFNEWLCAELG